MVSVAKMLRTTVKKLLDINPDIKDPASKCHLCVCVCVCVCVCAPERSSRHEFTHALALILTRTRHVYNVLYAYTSTSSDVKAGSMVCVQPCTDIYFATTKV